jgi:hypothetical protein
VFLKNRSQGTGAAIDPGGKLGPNHQLPVRRQRLNTWKIGGKTSGERPFVNNGVLTVFGIRAIVRGTLPAIATERTTGGESVYATAFVDNKLDAGLKGFARYELAVNAGAKVSGCFIKGTLHDVRRDVSATENLLNAPPPQFNKDYVPEAPEYKNAGYRPVSIVSNPTAKKSDGDPLPPNPPHP